MFPRSHSKRLQPKRLHSPSDHEDQPSSPLRSPSTLLRSTPSKQSSAMQLRSPSKQPLVFQVHSPSKRSSVIPPCCPSKKPSVVPPQSPAKQQFVVNPLTPSKQPSVVQLRSPSKRICSPVVRLQSPNKRMVVSKDISTPTSNSKKRNDEPMDEDSPSDLSDQGSPSTPSVKGSRCVSILSYIVFVIAFQRTIFNFKNIFLFFLFNENCQTQ